MYSVVLLMAMSTGTEMPACHLRKRRHGCHGDSAASCAVSYEAPACCGSAVPPPPPVDEGKMLEGNEKKTTPKVEGESKVLPLTKEEEGWLAEVLKLNKDASKKDKETFTNNFKEGTHEERKKMYMDAKKAAEDTDKDESRAPAPATILVRLPAQARLTIDGSPTRATTAVRHFVTPPLQKGIAYSYLFTAELMQDGQKVLVSKKVSISAGAETRVQFEFPAANSVTRK